VRDIMRLRDQMALLPPAASVIEVIRQMTNKRCGCATIVEPSGKLIGIFTHGDFARHFPQSPNIGTLPVQEFMTYQPVTISGDKLAAEVLHVLKTHRIDDLVVVDAENCPIGLIDSQDLTRLKML
jgi:arabinose-5-phosphate isomerase